MVTLLSWVLEVKLLNKSPKKSAPCKYRILTFEGLILLMAHLNNQSHVRIPVLQKKLFEKMILQSDSEKYWNLLSRKLTHQGCKKYMIRIQNLKGLKFMKCKIISSWRYYTLMLNLLVPNKLTTRPLFHNISQAITHGFSY